jgi:lysozyme family protein
MTYPKTFDTWYNAIVSPKIEGGVANRKLSEDPAGLTFRGFTFKNFILWAKSDLGIEPTQTNFLKLNDDQLKKVYYKRYWIAGKIDKVKPELQIVAMDSVFNGGGIPSLSPKDSKGKSTFSTVEALNNSGLTVADTLKNRDLYLKSLKNYEANKNGWAKRLKELANISLKNAPSIVLPFFLLILIVFIFLFKF